MLVIHTDLPGWCWFLRGGSLNDAAWQRPLGVLPDKRGLNLRRVHPAYPFLRICLGNKLKRISECLGERCETGWILRLSLLQRYADIGRFVGISGALLPLFIWPIEAEYRIVDLDPDYRTVIVGRTQRDYVWIMARTPRISESVYARLIEHVGALGYDVGKVRKVPQRWPES
jgi:Lipocalin-like domain